MTYTKQTWADGPTGGTPLSAERLQHIEDGVDAVGADVAAEATTRSAADLLRVLKAGDTMSGDLAMGGHKVTGLADPTSAQEAATRAYVLAQIAALVNSAPGILDTLGEIAAALQADESAATALATTVAGKVALTGNETIAGTKTFSSSPVVPDASFAIAKTTGLQTVLNGKEQRHAVPVATRAWGPAKSLSNGTSLGGTTRIKGLVSVSASQIQIAYSNSYGNAGVETDGPNSITVKAAIEYPSGVFNPVFFRGSRTVVIEPGATVLSDPVGIDVIAGDDIFYRSYVVVAAGEKFPMGPVNSVSGDGEGTNYSNTAPSELTTSGTVGTNTSTSVFAPTGVFGVPYPAASPAVAVIGDSIPTGTGDTLTDNGFVNRALSGVKAFQRVTMPSDTAQAFIANAGGRRRRMPTIKDCNYAIVEYGINDLVAVRTLSQIQADLTAIWTLLRNRGMAVYQTTITPRTTSTDAWATVANQTAFAQSATRISLNDWIRTIPAPLTGYFEVADTVESARNSGKWAAALTADGTHPTAAGHALMVAAINTALFV